LPPPSTRFPYTTLFRSRHDEPGHLEHDVRNLLDPVDDSLRFRAERCCRGAEEDREDHYLQNLVVGEGLERAARYEVRDEFLQRQDRKSTRLNSSHGSIS